MVDLEQFKRDLAKLINEHSLESTFGNTSDYVLANYAVASMMNFALGAELRDIHNGNIDTPTEE